MIIKTFKVNHVKQKQPFVLAKNQQVLLYTVGDVHYPHPGFPQELFLDTLGWAADRGAYFIGVGDYFDFAAHSQRQQIAPLRDSTKQEIDGMLRDRADRFIELIGFTKGRWVGMLEGNHRWDFTDGTSIDQYLCSALKCDFLGTMALVRLIPQSIPKDHPEAACTLCIHHGIGMSRLIGGNLHRLEDVLKWVDADVYIMGHSHAKIAAPIDRQCLSPEGAHYHQTKLIVRSGSWLKGYDSHEPLPLEAAANQSRGSYVEEKAYMPSSLGGVCIGIGYEQIKHSKFYRPTIHFSI